MCVGLPKTAEHLFLAAFFFVSFFWASKRKKFNRNMFQLKDIQYPLPNENYL